VHSQHYSRQNSLKKSYDVSPISVVRAMEEAGKSNHGLRTPSPRWSRRQGGFFRGRGGSIFDLAMDVQESDAAPEGLGMAEGISDGAQMVRYVNPAQCV
jgi:hypothetical protein